MLFVKHKSNMLRSISAGHRNTLIKRLQQIFITYHRELKRIKKLSEFDKE
ncbi:MAG: hypothetical protein IJQ50_04350 [Clostridia bacterium]|nr:hypothetical protein [Clostridia bacterium]